MNDNRTITFDPARALRYDPLGVRDPGDRVLKFARLVERAEGVVSTIVPEWGGEQKFVGSYYEVINPYTGAVEYGSAKREWEETNTLDALEDPSYGAAAWYKSKPIDAYQSTEAGELITTLADGTEETRKPVEVGDWLVRQHHGEIMCVGNKKFPKLYDPATARTLPKDD